MANLLPFAAVNHITLGLGIAYVSPAHRELILEVALMIVV
jgi:hypothetical protein